MQKHIALLFVFMIFASQNLLAAAPAASGPASFSYEGRVTDTYGTPSQQTVTFTVRIYAPDQICMLREEQTAPVDLSQTNGYFSVTLGSTTTANSPSITLANLFLNTTNLTGANPANSYSACSYAPASGDGRYVQILVTDSTGTVAMQPNIPLGTSPFAMSADSLQGLQPSAFILANSTSKALTQANLESVFATTANVTNLVSLIGAGANPNGASQVPGLSVNPSSPSAGQIWYNTSNNQLMLYNGSTSVNLSSGGGGGVSSITAGPGLVGGTITSSGTISLAGSGVTAGNYNTVTVDTYGRVTAGGSPTTVAGYGITDAVKNLSGVPGLQSGLDGSKPTAGTVGRVYFGSDSKTIYRDNGTAWDVLASGGSMTSSISGGTVYLPSASQSNPIGGAENFIQNLSATDGSFAGLGLQVRNASGNVQNSYILSVAQTGGSTWGSSIVMGRQSGSGSYAESLRIDQNGNLGIGTTTPSYPLDVIGPINTSSRYQLAGMTILGLPGNVGSNLGVGASAGSALTASSSFNTAVGSATLQVATTSAYDTAIGSYSLNQQTNGTANTAVGYKSGSSVTSGSSNTLLGYQAGGAMLQTGGLNVLIGTSADTPSPSTSNFMNIGNILFGLNVSNGYTYGNGLIGIGTNNPQTTLDIAGQFRTSGTVPTVSSCGTSPSIVGTDQAGKLIMGSGALVACQINFHATLNVAPAACLISPANATAAAQSTTGAYVSGISTSAWAVAGSNLSGAAYYYHCY